MTIAVTADIVGSRQLVNRDHAQAQIEAVIRRVAEDVPGVARPLEPVVGDELQGEFETLSRALASILLIRLGLPDGIDLRFGVGSGESFGVESARGVLPEGPAWWAAREAIERVHALEQRAVPRARTWLVAHNDSTGTVPVTNAYLLARDEIVGAMSERARRLTYGRCLDVSQRELAEREGITQSAVSQLLAAAGASSIVEGFRSLRATEN
ncbi:SatD family protein [Microbacterium lacus]|uniref:SatD family protein n=1 Tax=Microbacterium lacus TaxID=415217 RepID=UPI00384BE7C5